MKIDLSSFMNNAIFETLNGVYKDKSEISNIKDKINNDDISTIKTNSSGAKNTYFTTQINGQENVVGVNLSDTSLQKLRDFFKNDISIDEKGNTILSGKANEYISGWFNDIAFRRGHLAADKDNKGYVDESGVKNLHIDARMGMKLGTNNTYNATNFSTYLQTDSKLIAAGAYKNFKMSIDEALEDSINQDTNFDGKISVKEVELYYNKENINTITDTSLIVNTDTYNDNYSFFQVKQQSSDIVDRQKKELELLEAMAALASIINKINKDGTQALTNDDKEKLSILNITPNSLKSPQKLINAAENALSYTADKIGVDKKEFIAKSQENPKYASDTLNTFNELKSLFFNDLKNKHLLDIKA